MSTSGGVDGQMLSTRSHTKDWNGSGAGGFIKDQSGVILLIIK